MYEPIDVPGCTDADGPTFTGGWLPLPCRLSHPPPSAVTSLGRVTTYDAVRRRHPMLDTPLPNSTPRVMSLLLPKRYVKWNMKVPTACVSTLHHFHTVNDSRTKMKLLPEKLVTIVYVGICFSWLCRASTKFVKNKIFYQVYSKNLWLKLDKNESNSGIDA